MTLFLVNFKKKNFKKKKKKPYKQNNPHIGGHISNNKLITVKNKHIIEQLKIQNLI